MRDFSVQMDHTNRPSGWTYGAEHEFGDWDQRRGLPEGFKMDRRDITIVNSNGIAADPRGKLWPYGGEINTPPTSTADGQADCLLQILGMHPDAVVNYRSNLHVHVRVPNLREDLEALKHLQRYVQEWAPQVLNLVEPIPRPTPREYPEAEAYNGALKRYRRRLRSHHTVLTHKRAERMLSAVSCEEFFRREVPTSGNGDPLWHLQPRAAINLRQMLETDTIEFRHFPGTLDPAELLTCVDWCRDFLVCAFHGRSPVELYNDLYRERKWPKFQPYIHELENVYQQTVVHANIDRREIIRAIREHTGYEYDWRAQSLRLCPPRVALP